MPSLLCGDLLALGGSREASPIAGQNSTSGGRARVTSAQGTARAADSRNAPLTSDSETEIGPASLAANNVLAGSLIDRVAACNRRHHIASQRINREKPGASEALQLGRPDGMKCGNRGHMETHAWRTYLTILDPQRTYHHRFPIASHTIASPPYLSPLHRSITAVTKEQHDPYIPSRRRRSEYSVLV